MTAIGKWIFTSGEPRKERTGNWGPLETVGRSVLTPNGLLVRKGGWARVRGYKGAPIAEKTLVVWLRLNSLVQLQPAGSAMSLDAITYEQFDAIAFGEQKSGTWMAGSTGFRRTQAPARASATERGAGEIIQLAASYKASGRNKVSVTLSRNAEVSANYDVNGPLPVWPPGEAEILFGSRHTIENQTLGYLEATILQAELHDKALTTQQLKELSFERPTLATRFVFSKIPGTAQYKHASWTGQVSRERISNVEAAKEYARNAADVGYFFHVSSGGFFLEGGPGSFTAGDAVFFKGIPHLGSAPGSDTYLVAEEYDTADSATRQHLQEVIGRFKIPDVNITPKGMRKVGFVFADFSDLQGTGSRPAHTPAAASFRSRSIVTGTARSVPRRRSS